MDATRVLTCRGCGSAILEPIDSLGNFPYANLFPSQIPDVWPTNRLALTVCRECSLCQLDIYPNLSELYLDYIWITSSSTFIHEYLDGLVDRLLSLSPEKYSKVVEIASNDATLLEKFDGHSNQLIGIEPAKNLATYYSGTNINLISDLFNSECVEKNQALLSNSSLIIARNVLAHVPDISSFINACKSCLSPKGFLYLEFHDGDEILSKLQFDSIYHEHQSYISEKSLAKILMKQGFKIDASWLGPIGGSSRSVIASLSDDYKIDGQDQESIHLDNNLCLKEIQRWKEFRKKLDKYKTTLYELLADARSKGLTIVGFGASARSTTLACFCDLSQWLIEIVDSSSAKHGRVWTGSNLIVKSPAEVDWLIVDIVVLLAWNFQEEILDQLTTLGFKGKVLRVLPNEPTYIS